VIKMNVAGLTIDPLTNSPIIILKDESGENTLPIWIGLLEATAIASELENIEFSRPMTHDLFRNVLGELGAKLERIEVIDLRDNTYYAVIHLALAERRLVIDARPSDAIALALRVQAPIFVAPDVLDVSQHSKSEVEAQVGTEEGKKWTEVLESLSPEDFGKYKM
jgi:bifunctional DNase/RNase